MSWYTQWSDSIKKRACRYLLQRYLGQFLEEKLTLDQLSVDIYCGTGSVSNVGIDVQALNELGDEKNLPVEFVDGYVAEISVSIPWATLFTDSIYVEVSGLHITVQPKQRPDNACSMLESMWSSMASSIQLAAECLKHEATTVDGAEQDTETNMDGLEIFAHAIESILTRVKIKLINTSVRLEHVPKEGKNGIAFELKISNVEYCDETSCETSSGDCAGEPKQNSSFSIKKFHCEGVSFHTDEFPVGGRTFSRDVAQTKTKNLNCDKYVNETESIIIAKLFGLQEVRIKLKLDPAALGSKVDLEFNLGLLTLFLSPRQLYLLFEIFNSLASPHTQDTSNISSKRSLGEKLMSSRDFKKVEQELQDTLNFPIYSTNVPKLSQGRGWSSPSFDEGEDEYFLPMKLTSSLTGSCVSDKTTDTSFTSNTSLPYYSTKMDNMLSCETYSNLYGIGQKKVDKGCEADTHEETSSYHISLGGIVLILLTEDILTFGMDAACLTPSSVSVMISHAKQFFEGISSLGFGSRSIYKDFGTTTGKSFFDASICSLNHVRLLATSVIIEGSDGGNMNNYIFSTTVSSASLEILECLVEKNTSASGKLQFVELLKFMRSNTEGNVKPHFQLTNQPDIRMHVQHIKKRQRSKLSSNLIVSLNLEQCWSELDLSIFDRISTITCPQTLCQVISTPREIMNQHSSFTQAVENTALCDRSYVFNIKSPYFVVKFRFPIPDLRPIHEKGKLSEWQRSIRNDILYVNFIEPQFFTEIITKIPNQEYFVSCKEILVLFQEGDINSAIPFIKATGLNSTSATNQNLENKTETQVRFSLRLCPLQVVGDVEEFCEKEDNSGLSCSSFMDQPSKEPSPFISKKVIHETNAHDHSACEGEELIMPAPKEDMQKFINSSQENSKIQVNITLPCLTVLFSTKHVYEVIYNRLTSDLSLWHSNGMNNLRNKSLSSQFDFSPLLQPSFSLCKSALQFESDESDEDETPSFKISQKGETSHYGQSYLSINIHINKGSLNICPNVKDEKGNVCPEKYGGMLFLLQEGNIFSVTNYKGKPQQNYICVQVNNMGVHHKEEVDLPRSEYVLRMQTQSASQMRLDPVLVKSNKEVIATNLCPEGRGGNMFSTAISTTVNERKIKTIRVACSLSGATLRHRVAKHHQSWLSHLMDFFDVVDYPVKGYESPQFITEFYLHIWDSAIDYRPVNLPLRCVLTLGNLSISSNITRAKTSTLRFIAEEASLFISQKTRKGYNEESFVPNLRSDYISVVQLGLLELSLRLTDLPNMPKVDLKVSNNLVEIRTCADSATALAQLLRYYVSDGDLGVKIGSNEVKNKANGEDKEESEKSDTPNKVDTLDPTTVTALSDSTTERLHDMMEDAMKEEISSLVHLSDKDTEIKNEDVEVFYFPDEGTQQSNPIDWGENNFSQDHDFCVLEHEANEGIKGEDGRPEIRLLTEEPVRIIDNHFSMCVGRTDSLLSPKYYPTPVSKYTLTDMTLIWHMYGGSDFSQTKKSVNFEQRENGNPNTTGLNYRTSNKDKDKDLPRSNASNNTYFLDGNWSSIQQNRKRHSRFDKSNWQLAGGSERKHSVLMQLQFNKVRFQHEIYPEKTTQASREVLLINEFEIRDRLSSSQINKFLYQYSSETNPRQSHANMVVIKAVHLRSDTQRNIQETCLKVSLLPLRLNIDQDSLQFLFTFFNQLSGLSITSKCEEDLGSALGTIHSSPVMGVTSAESTTSEETTMTETTSEISHTAPRVARSPPLFIRNFIFSPEVPIRIDYEGKRVDLTHGPLAGLLMGLAQLNCLQIRLKRLSYKHGLLGLDRLISYALTEWVNDIKKTQFPNLLGGVGPMHALVQFFQGIRDLFWLPIEQYQKDGRIVRGLQRGANSFTTSTAIAALELTARIVQAIQSIAEAAFDMVSPGPSVRRSHGNRCKKQHCYSHPSDIREGVANAYTLVKEGLGETAETLVRVASAEAEQKGAVGAVGGVLRQLPPTVVAPIILATAATSNLIGGVHSQLAPDSRREATLKWRATPKS